MILKSLTTEAPHEGDWDGSSSKHDTDALDFMDITYYKTPRTSLVPSEFEPEIPVPPDDEVLFGKIGCSG